MSADDATGGCGHPRVQENWPRAVQLPAGQHRLCGCRNSPDWPRCDAECCVQPGAEQVLALAKPRFIWMCQCGQSREMPYCDGEGHIQA